jgi:hypothetical protein
MHYFIEISAPNDRNSALESIIFRSLEMAAEAVFLRPLIALEIIFSVVSRAEFLIFRCEY